MLISSAPVVGVFISLVAGLSNVQSLAFFSAFSDPRLLLSRGTVRYFLAPPPACRHPQPLPFAPLHFSNPCRPMPFPLIDETGRRTESNLRPSATRLAVAPFPTRFPSPSALMVAQLPRPHVARSSA